jgi:catechol 1,2-dioxygenase
MATVNGAAKIEYDPTFTDNVIAATGPNTNPRLREVMTALIRHVHDFAREVNLTTDEYMAGVQLLNWAGQMSTDRRNEGQLVTDVIGLESLVDEITYKQAAAKSTSATPSAILGPFWRHDAPTRKNGESIILKTPDDGKVAYFYGRITDGNTGKPLANACVDVWQASTNGLYEQQDEDQPDHNLRGKFYTDSDGNYGFYCLRPTPYPVSPHSMHLGSCMY